MKSGCSGAVWCTGGCGAGTPRHGFESKANDEMRDLQAAQRYKLGTSWVSGVAPHPSSPHTRCYACSATAPSACTGMPQSDPLLTAGLGPCSGVNSRGEGRAMQHFTRVELESSTIVTIEAVTSHFRTLASHFGTLASHFGTLESHLRRGVHHEREGDGHLTRPNHQTDLVPLRDDRQLLRVVVPCVADYLIQS